MVEQKSPTPTHQLRIPVEEAATILRSFGAREVYVFGSAALGAVGPDSDLDLAVGGMPPDRFFPAIARLMSASNRRIDLIDLDEDSPFVRHLQQEGLLKRVG